MSKISYKIQRAELDALNLSDGIKEEDKKLVESFEINSSFLPKEHQVEVTAYAADGFILQYLDDYREYRNDSSIADPTQDTLSGLELNPANDSIVLGFPNGDVYLHYNFINNLLVEGKQEGDVFIEAISSDRTELRLISRLEDTVDLKERVDAVQEKLSSTSYYGGPYLNFGENTLLGIVNIKAEAYKGKTAILVKLYEALPKFIQEKEVCTLVEKVLDSALFEIQATEEPDPIIVPTLKGPNFNVEVNEENNNPTEYLNYNELFSYPVTNSYYELHSLFSEKSAQISVDHNDFSTFIHFSSAEERLRNFKYKVDLISSYNEAIATINSTGYTSTGITGSLEYYNKLTEGIVNNFDHYERFLYFESGSNSWPKTNSTRPYELDTVNTGSWYDAQIIAANNYDNSNLDVLTNTVPEFIREDGRNEAMIMFVHMLGQHFDNLWLYHKSVADKYDADNRLNYGISKDLVREALESFGVKLYNSNLNLGQLFSMFTGQAYDAGNEDINTYLVATDNTAESHLQPMPLDNYQKEVYKRIYHNLPLLTKGKGTERGLRALINCFGIPSEMLQIRIFGGQDSDAPPFYGPFYSTTSSLDKVRLDATGSIVSGSTLSSLTSIVKPDDRYSTDVHTVEIGVSHTNNIDSYIQQNISSTFDIDEYIGDPRDAYNSRYTELDNLAEDILSNLDRYDVRDFVRLIKFFDNSIFRIVRDFIPARSNINSGIIVKPHILDRSKAKEVEVSWTQPEYTGSLEIGEYSGSSGDAFGGQDQYSTSWVETVITLSGSTELEYHNHEEPKYDGEFSGSLIDPTDGELNDENLDKKPNTKLPIYNLHLIDSRATFCNLSFSASYATSTPTPTPTAPSPVAPSPVAPSPIAPASPTPNTETYYRIEDCNSGLDYTASKTVFCIGGSETLPMSNFSIGDIVQFAPGTGCPAGATQCGTITDINFIASAPDAVITRDQVITSCGDFLHCSQ